MSYLPSREKGPTFTVNASPPAGLSRPYRQSIGVPRNKGVEIVCDVVHPMQVCCCAVFSVHLRLLEVFVWLDRCVRACIYSHTEGVTSVLHPFLVLLCVMCLYHADITVALVSKVASSNPNATNGSRHSEGGIRHTDESQV